LQIKTKLVCCHRADSKPVKQEVTGTVILPPLVFPERTLHKGRYGDEEATVAYITVSVNYTLKKFYSTGPWGCFIKALQTKLTAVKKRE
jgi:hypothetical protein